MKSISKPIFLALIVCCASIAVLGQETQETIVDEVIAQVNDDVITLSQVKREKQNIVDQYMIDGKTREEAEAEAAKNEGQMIANLIIEEMLRQKGVEVGLEKSVEAEVNQRLLGLVKSNNLKSINELYDMMRGSGVDPDVLKKTWSASLMKDSVLRQLSDATVYWETSDQELKDYFAKNKDKFAQVEMVELSEIFLAFAGKDEAEVEKLAKSIAQRARNGEDFIALAIQYSERPGVAESKGVVGEFEVAKLNDDIKDAIKGLKTGAIAEPIKWDIGMEIVRVDKHVPASNDSNFDESRIRLAILEEKAPAARVEFINKLREDSYIKIRERYRGVVSPFLIKGPAAETTSTNTSMSN